MKITELIKKLEEMMRTVVSLDTDLHNASSHIQGAIDSNNELDTELSTIISKLEETQKNMEVK